MAEEEEVEEEGEWEQLMMTPFPPLLHQPMSLSITATA
jgi:hypothetical protein